MTLARIPVPMRRIMYLSKRLTYRAMARETGISVTILQGVHQGTMGLPSQYSTSLRNLYRRESYLRMRDAGMSVSQATRFSGGAVTTVEARTARTESIIEHLTAGVMAGRQEKYAARGIYFDVDFEYERARASIWTGLRKSHKTIEDWERYPTTAPWLVE